MESMTLTPSFWQLTIPALTFQQPLQIGLQWRVRFTCGGWPSPNVERNPMLTIWNFPVAQAVVSRPSLMFWPQYVAIPPWTRPWRPVVGSKRQPTKPRIMRRKEEEANEESWISILKVVKNDVRINWKLNIKVFMDRIWLSN